jgi:pilus assembly protein CpaF
MAEFLKVCASVRLNIVVAGGTGAGKTTLLNSIANHIRPGERIVTIENPAELRLTAPNVVRLEWVENHTMLQRITPRDLVKNALRMRPNRIIVGEVRGAEAFDMMQAMNTGHEGSLTTIHANTPRDCLGRIENMISMADLNLPPASVRKQIATAIHLIVQIMRSEDGVRRVTKISEVVGMESDMIVMQDIFSFKQTGVDEKGCVLGQHVWGGIFPKHQELSRALREAGMLTIVGGLKS